MRPVSERDETAALEGREGEAPSLGGLAGNQGRPRNRKQFEPQPQIPRGQATSQPFRSAFETASAGQQTHNLKRLQQG